ncbi:SDR family NAD(P)-dependent oxidoreductase [Nocardiopsis dassonvillei]|uniref:SDR family NAD(P)-dependent oxidoreductase n=1 Tax=Nocardiopsis dassonvillei TaxID=2014 RepID=UPI0020A3210A|nr:SDR family NAD(P)-dependent oxidoreductase [Nocardiopsis dassonvillei]MCP3011985.1 SDR family NAD(P)-dependent oxidoreductase [Nocardiopsis dassonvillei]
MDLEGARVLVAGATGVLGKHISRALNREGTRVVLAGRDEEALDALARELDGSSTAVFEAADTEGCAALVRRTAEEQGGLDGLVIAFGVVAFDTGSDTGSGIDDAAVEKMFQVNTLAPMAMLRAAVGAVKPGGAVAAVTAVTAEYPTHGMAAYSASKAALSAWLTAARADYRTRHVAALDVRAPHMDTGLADRPLAGTAPANLPEPHPVDEVADAIVRALRSDARTVAFDPRERKLTVR